MNLRNYLTKASNKNPAFWCFQEKEKECIGNKWVKSATDIRKSRNYLMEEKWDKLLFKNSIKIFEINNVQI